VQLSSSHLTEGPSLRPLKAGMKSTACSGLEKEGKLEYHQLHDSIGLGSEKGWFSLSVSSDAGMERWTPRIDQACPDDRQELVAAPLAVLTLFPRGVR
jgi:hypothetical protein